MTIPREVCPQCGNGGVCRWDIYWNFAGWYCLNCRPVRHGEREAWDAGYAR